MRTPLEQSVLQAIQRSGMLAPGDRVGVAVSGGADSVALLRLLAPLARRSRNHARRSAFQSLVARDGIRWRRRIRRATRASVTGSSSSLPAKTLPRKPNGRAAIWKTWRASCVTLFSTRVVAEGRATHIAVAHTADDQAETVLAHIIRGTGLTGLGGIHPSQEQSCGHCSATRREQLREYLRAIGQPWREDSTNRDTRRTRARIREQLLPLLARDFSPAVADHLNELARFAREEESFWNALVEDRFQALVRCEEDGEAFSIPVNALLHPLELHATPSQIANSAKCNDSQPLRVLTERLIRRLYEYVRGNRRELSCSPRRTSNPHRERLAQRPPRGASRWNYRATKFSGSDFRPGAHASSRREASASTSADVRAPAQSRKRRAPRRNPPPRPRAERVRICCDACRWPAPPQYPFRNSENASG